MAEQWVLYRAYQRGGTLAAFPSPNAPHIRVGRQAHAIDVNSLDGGENRLQAWLRHQGVRAENTVAGESWHLEVPEADLKRLAARLTDPFKGYPEDEVRWMREYDALKRAGRDRTRREVLQRVMKQRRQEIFRAASKDGWHKNSRTKRYASLRART
jgi:hypothetical protein